MLVQKEREHLDAIIKAVSDKAQRIELLNKMAMEAPVLYDKKIQKESISEALRQATELRVILEETIIILQKDQVEELDVYGESKAHD